MAAALCACLLGGCASSSAPSLTLGDASAAAGATSISNETGQAIEAVFLKRNTDADYGDALAASAAFAEGAAAELELPEADVLYDLKFQTATGASYELSALDLSGMQNCVLKLSGTGSSSYIEYTSAESGEAACVLESEQRMLTAEKEAASAKKEAKKAKKKLKAAKKAAAKAAAEEKKREEAEAAEAAEAAAAESSGSSSSSSTSSSSSSSSSSKKSTTTPTDTSDSGDDAEDVRCIEL